MVSLTWDNILYSIILILALEFPLIIVAVILFHGINDMLVLTSFTHHVGVVLLLHPSQQYSNVGISESHFRSSGFSSNTGSQQIVYSAN